MMTIQELNLSSHFQALLEEIGQRQVMLLFKGIT